MKLATFELFGASRLGLVEGEQVLDLTEYIGYSDILAYLRGEGGNPARAMRAASDKNLTRHNLAQVRLKAPLPNPSKVIAIGLNYMDHCREQNVPVPQHPIVFAKFPSSIIGTQEAISWDTGLTSQVDLEVELGVVIGKRARRVSQAEAMDHVFGYTVINDVSARDLQFGDKQWVRGKSLDTFCPCGPYVVTVDEITNPHALPLRSTINGQVMQDSNTSEMIFNVPYLVSFLSQAFTLEPGDLIATGTPNGVGVFRKPQVFLQDGDLVEVEVQGIGRLANPVKLG
jgi:2-keto-4-pentenoate hydratase/2-oxohepta-3-ene-1,7-dioic acid hydratase in catechol pathway